MGSTPLTPEIERRLDELVDAGVYNYADARAYLDISPEYPNGLPSRKPQPDYLGHKYGVVHNPNMTKEQIDLNAAWIKTIRAGLSRAAN